MELIPLAVYVVGFLFMFCCGTWYQRRHRSNIDHEVSADYGPLVLAFLWPILLVSGIFCWLVGTGAGTFKRPNPMSEI